MKLFQGHFIVRLHRTLCYLTAGHYWKRGHEDECFCIWCGQDKATWEKRNCFWMKNDQLTTDAEIQAYLRSLRPHERVIETGESCMTGRKGTVYISQNEMTAGSTCVRWDVLPGEGGQMGTSVTWGTRRLQDVDLNEGSK